MKTKFTPGPWELQENGCAMFGHQVLAKDEDQHPNDTSRVILAQTHNIATARLIAVAPELLQACREAAEQLDSVCRDLAALVELTDACLSTNAIRQGSTLAKVSAVNCDRTLQRVRAVIGKATLDSELASR